jgi:hypothetical protein
MHDQRRWERQRESTLVFSEAMVVEQAAQLHEHAARLREQAAQLREQTAQFDDWRAYIHELERELGRPLSGAADPASVHEPIRAEEPSGGARTQPTTQQPP